MGDPARSTSGVRRADASRPSPRRGARARAPVRKSALHFLSPAGEERPMIDKILELSRPGDVANWWHRAKEERTILVHPLSDAERDYLEIYSSDAIPAALMIRGTRFRNRYRSDFFRAYLRRVDATHRGVLS